MSRPLPVLAAASVLALGACGAEPPATVTAPLAAGPSVLEEGDRAGTDRVEVEVGSETATEAPTSQGEPAWTLVRLGAAEVEDERGQLVPSTAALAFDLDAHRFPPRALDPVLHVGVRALRRYHHPRIGTLRFVLAEDALPPDGSAIFVQYGDDVASRVELGALRRAAIVAPAPESGAQQP